MNIITVLQSFIELFTNEYGMGANPWLGVRRTHGGGQLVGPVVTDGI